MLSLGSVSVWLALHFCTVMAVNKLDIAARTAFEARRAFILLRLYYLNVASEGQKRRESPSFAATNISTHQGFIGLGSRRITDAKLPQLFSSEASIGNKKACRIMHAAVCLNSSASWPSNGTFAISGPPRPSVPRSSDPTSTEYSWLPAYKGPCSVIDHVYPEAASSVW